MERGKKEKVEKSGKNKKRKKKTRKNQKRKKKRKKGERRREKKPFGPDLRSTAAAQRPLQPRSPVLLCPLVLLQLQSSRARAAHPAVTSHFSGKFKVSA